MYTSFLVSTSSLARREMRLNNAVSMGSCKKVVLLPDEAESSDFLHIVRALPAERGDKVEAPDSL